MKDEDISSLFYSFFSLRYHRHVCFRYCDCNLRLHRAARDGVLLRFPASDPPAPQDQPRMRCYPLGVQVCKSKKGRLESGTHNPFLPFRQFLLLVTAVSISVVWAVFRKEDWAWALQG